MRRTKSQILDSETEDEGECADGESAFQKSQRSLSEAFNWSMNFVKVRRSTVVSESSTNTSTSS